MKTYFWGLALGKWAVVGGFALLASASAAGNQVEVLQEGELVKVFGDNAANNIAIAQNLNGDITVTGRNGTLVNGRTSVRLPRVPLNAMEIDMGGGNDIVALSNLRIANDLFVNLGEGANRLLTGAAPSSVGANVAIEGGMSSDLIRLTQWTIGGDLAIDGKGGVLDALLTGLDVGFGLTVIGDAANDIINLQGCTVGDTTSLEGKGGANRVTVNDFVGFDLHASTDFGNDIITFSAIMTTGDVGVVTGVGNDRVVMTNVFSGKNLLVSLDAGADFYQGTNVMVTYDAVFEGGAGVDTFKDFGISAGIKKEIKEFELF
jgi:hypothetical protein